VSKSLRALVRARRRARPAWEGLLKSEGDVLKPFQGHRRDVARQARRDDVDMLTGQSRRPALELLEETTKRTAQSLRAGVP
jgi:hypothetical protein